jgi:hypothetical protein
VFKRVLDINFEEVIPIWNYIKNKIPIEKLLLIQIEKTIFLKLVVVRSFCFGLILSPPLAWIAKNGYLWVKYKPFITFSPYGKQYMSEDYTKLESGVERRRRMNNTMEWSGSLVFAEDSISLWIYDLAWNALEKHISHSKWKRWSKVCKWAMCAKESIKVPRIKNI